MADETLAHLITGAASTIFSTVAAFVAMVRKLTSRLGALEERLDGLEALVTKLKRQLDDAPRAADRTIPPGGAVTSEYVKTTARREANAAARAVLGDIQDVLKQIRALAEAALPKAQFADHVEQQADRMSEINRAIGRIEGALDTLGQTLRGRS